jgi:Skp family chaperone for outer membrane proteins
MRFARFNTAVIVAPLALLICAALPNFARAQGTTKIAVANPVKIFNDLQETKDLRAKMDNDQKQAETLRVQKTSHLKDTKEQRDSYDQKSAKYNEMNQKYLAEAIELDTWSKITAVQLQNDQKQKIADLYAKILRGIATVATAQKVDLVLADQAPQLPDNLESIDVNQLRAILGSRNILYFGAGADITDAVVTEMDKSYKAGDK